MMGIFFNQDFPSYFYSVFQTKISNDAGFNELILYVWPVFCSSQTSQGIKHHADPQPNI